MVWESMSFLISKPVQARVDALLGEFALACPPPGKATKPITSQTVEKALSGLCGETARLVREQKLGVLRRAALAKSVQKGLIDAGYPLEMVTKIVNALTVSALVGKPARMREAENQT